MTILAVLWEKTLGGGQISYLVFDKSTLSVLVAPTKLILSNTQSVEQTVNQLFTVSRQNNVNEMEYKILQHGTPATNFRGQPAKPPHELSQAIFDAVVQNATTLQVTMKPQIKTKLKGDSLKKFRAALADLQLVNSGSGTAWESHLWAVAVHATDTNVEKVIRKIWSRLKQVSVRSEVEKTQFLTWYENL